MMPGSKITGFMRSTVKMTGKVGSYMKIQDFCDMNKFEQIMKNWANSTGLATVAVDADGKYISDCYNFTEFCIDLTRGSAEGKKRCEQCDREVACQLVPHCARCISGAAISHTSRYMPDPVYQRESA